jgi:chaperonin cofactor prefoldin
MDQPQFGLDDITIALESLNTVIDHDKRKIIDLTNKVHFLEVENDRLCSQIHGLDFKIFQLKEQLNDITNNAKAFGLGITFAFALTVSGILRIIK